MTDHPAEVSAVWLNGDLVPQDLARVSIADHGYTVGDGLFETLAVRDGQPFALTRHLRRLVSSASALGLTCPSAEELRHAVAQTLEAAPGAGRLRLTVTSGPGPAGSVRGLGPTSVVVAAGPGSVRLGGPAREAAGPGVAKSSDKSHREVSVVQLPWVRNERSPLTGHKSTSYGESVQGMRYARLHHADEGILGNSRAELCEGVASNVFVEINGEILTPPISSGCLPGVTRELLLEWAAVAGLPLREATLPVAVLDAARAGRVSLAMTNSVQGVLLISHLDGHLLRHGPLTQAIAELYAHTSLGEIDP